MLHSEQWGPDNARKSCPRQIIKHNARKRGSESAGSCAPGDLPGKSCNEDWGGVSQLLSSPSANQAAVQAQAVLRSQVGREDNDPQGWTRRYFCRVGVPHENGVSESSMVISRV